MMKINWVNRWLALWLALVLTLPLAGIAEEQWPDEAEVVVEAEPAGETAAEQEQSPQPVEETGELIFVVPEEETSQQVLGEAGSTGEGAAQEGELTQGEPTSEEGAQSGDASQEADQEPEEAAPALAATSLKLGLKESLTLKLEGGLSPESVDAVFKSSNSKVVAVDKTTGKITGKKKGTATVTMTTSGGAVSECKVTVLKAPSKVKLSSKELKLGVGEEATLKASVRKSSASAFTFHSSDRKVVSVDDDGHLVALKKGTAKITVKTFNGKKAVCKVKVSAAPKSVSFSESVISIWLGDSYNAKVKLSKNSVGSYKLSSSDKDVVTVSGTKLKTVGTGTSIITVTTYNGLSAQMSVEVCRKPVYRALLVGESSFPGTKFCDLPANKDVAMMKKMLKSTKGPAKSGWSITTCYNQTTAQLEKDIATAFSGAQEGDVSLFYISTHGDEVNSFDSSTPEYAGYLMTYPDKQYSNWYERNTMTLVCLASWLKEVPGQVIVIIDSCGSGAAVYGAKGNAGGDFTPGSFDEAVVNAFESQDKGVMAPGIDEGAFVIQNKFFVLTSAGYQEACWTDDGKYSYFTKWLTDGISTKGKMPADRNKDKITTLNELYKYIKGRSEKTTIKAKNGSTYKQHVQVYPAGSDFGLFYRK